MVFRNLPIILLNLTSAAHILSRTYSGRGPQDAMANRPHRRNVFKAPDPTRMFFFLPQLTALCFLMESSELNPGQVTITSPANGCNSLLIGPPTLSTAGFRFSEHALEFLN